MKILHNFSVYAELLLHLKALLAGAFILLYRVFQPVKGPKMALGGGRRSAEGMPKLRDLPPPGVIEFSNFYQESDYALKDRQSSL